MGRRVEDGGGGIVAFAAGVVPVVYFIVLQDECCVAVQGGEGHDVFHGFGFGGFAGNLFFAAAVLVYLFHLLVYITLTTAVELGLVFVFAKHGGHVCFVYFVPRHYTQLYHALEADADK